MKKVFFVITIITIPIVMLWANDSDWESDSWGSDEPQDKISNTTFEKMKIKNRSKKEYDDKVYKYITGDYKAQNNNIELGTVHLNDRLKNSNVKVNVMVEDLKVEGDSYRDSLDIKKNKYKNFVQNDENGVDFFGKEEKEFNKNGVDGVETLVETDNSRYNKVPDEDVTELETIDLRDRDNIKEVNVFMEDVNIIVK
ncbi:hypothetical protein MNB_SV-13-527 [hydrothermal vent metagenome]|uniref:Uncharacterized protein n=1 Tax=hydrothermal vent metagenome TaxID=652676 RepID=A0A1W1CWK7_9ZZZZ